MVQDTGSVLLCEVRDEKLHLPGVDMPEEEDLSERIWSAGFSGSSCINNAQYAPFGGMGANDAPVWLSLEKLSSMISSMRASQVDQIDQDQNHGGEA
jgi:hypothetical protein